jgi:hypothetical protein
MLRRSFRFAPLALLLIAADARAATPEDALDDGSAADAPYRAAPPPLTWDRSKEGVAVGFGAMGFNAHTIGFGLIAESPTIAHWVRFGAGTGFALFPHPHEGGTEDFTPFGTGRLVVQVGPDYYGGFPLRPYAVAGSELFLLPSSLSSQRVAVGALGALGLEMAFSQDDGTRASTTCFVELGGLLTGARADALPSGGSIGSGFVGNAGFRVYL